jgi:hypothetical protein
VRIDASPKPPEASSAVMRFVANNGFDALVVLAELARILLPASSTLDHVSCAQARPKKSMARDFYTAVVQTALQLQIRELGRTKKKRRHCTMCQAHYRYQLEVLIQLVFWQL